MMKGYAIRSGLSGLWAGAVLASASAAWAAPESEPGIDVAVHETTRPQRILTIEWNPVPLVTIGKASGNIIITPIDHHGLVISPFYAWTDTADVFIFDDMGNATQLPVQKFRGFGAELGYRYYTRQGGPRGIFLGPSLLLGWFTVTAADGTEVKYLNYGLAADVGYQTLVADSVSVSLGAGLQLTTTSKTIPPQQFPAKFYANGGILPRLLLSIGWAF
jgi:hypothetical protein